MSKFINIHYKISNFRFWKNDSLEKILNKTHKTTHTFPKITRNKSPKTGQSPGPSLLINGFFGPDLETVHQKIGYFGGLRQKLLVLLRESQINFTKLFWSYTFSRTNLNIRLKIPRGSFQKPGNPRPTSYVFFGPDLETVHQKIGYFGN